MTQHIRTGLLTGLLTLISAIPVMSQYDFTISSTSGCTPMMVKYQFTRTASVDTISSYYWDFGNGQTSTLGNPDSVTYDAAGTYSPSLIFNNREDLKIEKSGLLTVHHTVPANFIYYDSVTYNTFIFVPSESTDTGTTYSYLWDFEGVGSRTGPREIITFPAQDTFRVVFTLSDNFGCTSTKTQFVEVLEKLSIQNVFSPNGDALNDFFVIVSNGGFPLRLRVFSRAGILVYEAEGSTLAWDGYTASGQELKSGIYYYTLEAISGDPGKRFTKAGFLYMFK